MVYAHLTFNWSVNNSNDLKKEKKNVALIRFNVHSRNEPFRREYIRYCKSYSYIFIENSIKSFYILYYYYCYYIIITKNVEFNITYGLNV